MIELRDYQREAIDALYSYFEQHDGHPLLVLPTGAGKSVIQAAFQREALQAWPQTRILLLTHVRELIAQNYEKLMTLWPQAPAGIYSAGMGRRDIGAQILFAGIQSIHKRAFDLEPVDLVIVDECHLVPGSGLGMYRTFLANLRRNAPHLRVIGLTATPYRLGSGLLTEGQDRLFTDIAYELPVRRLIDAGHLAPLISKRTVARADLSGVHRRGGEFVADELDAAMRAGGLTAAAISEVVEYGADRRSWLVFCCSVEHAHEARDALRTHGIAAECLHGGTPKAERDGLIAGFKAGHIRALTNCDVLTTGFDAPAVDLLVFLRATESTGLYVQMAGRGMRTAPDKRNCLVLDFAGNIERHGPVDAIRLKPRRAGTGSADDKPTDAPTKTCPDCEALLSAFARVCECGHEFPRIALPAHDATASSAAVMTAELVPDDYRSIQPVEGVGYSAHPAKPGKPPTVRVDYWSGMHRVASEWLCPLHGGFAGAKFGQWLQARFARPELLPDLQAQGALDDIDTIVDFLEAARDEGVLSTPHALVLDNRGRYPEIVRAIFDDEFANELTEPF